MRKSLGHYGTLSLAFVGLALVSLVGCADSRVRELEETSRSDFKDIRTRLAEHTAAIDQLKSDLRQISGKIEELQYTSVGKTAELERTLRQVSSRVPPPAGIPEDLLNRDDEAIGARSGAAADQYRTGLGQLRGGDFEGAARSFSDFYLTNPQTAFSDNALFWSGLAYERLGQYDRAISAFSDVFQKLPAEDMVPASLFYLGDCFEKMGKRQEASLTYQKLIAEHSRSPFAEKARQQMKFLGGKKTRSR